MKNIEMIIPTIEQINNSEIFCAYGKKAAVNDFAALQGTFVSYRNGYSNSVAKGEDLKSRPGNYWIRNNWNNMNMIYIVDTMGYDQWHYGYNREIGSRPALSYSSIKDFTFNEKEGKNGIIESEFSLFPKYVPEKGLQKEILGRIKHNELKKVDLFVPVDSRKWYDNGAFKLKYLNSYFFNGKIYTYFKAKPFGGQYLASNGVIYHENDKVIAEMSPIRLFSSEKENLTFFRDILIANQFDRITTFIRDGHEIVMSNYPNDFQDTDIYNYLNNYLGPYLLYASEYLKQNNKKLVLK